MDAAQHLHATLISFKQAGASEQTPQELLLSYCRQVLGPLEKHHFDFKEKRDTRHAGLDEDDQKNLAKSVSGFANSSGGVVIWGITDKNLRPKPIHDVTNFMSNILQMAAATTDPAVVGVNGDYILADGSTSDGFGILYIPESSLPPHRTILKIQEIQNHYYVRSGSSFVPATHSQLEDMFGRRPRPKLNLSLRYQVSEWNKKPAFRIYLGIKNIGRGAARAPYLAFRVPDPCHLWRGGLDGNYAVGLPKLPTAATDKTHCYGADGSTVIHAGVTREVVGIVVPLAEPPDNTAALTIDYQLAAEGIALLTDRMTFDGNGLWNKYEEMQADERKS